MRPLTEEETKVLFQKLAHYTGSSLKDLIAPREDGRYVFRLVKDRVYYVKESVANLAVSISRDNLLSVGICLGRFTKTRKFRLHITALPILSEHARYKIWVKPNGEMPLLYGSNVLKAHIGRASDDIPEHQGCVIFSMADVPLGFGVTAKAMAEVKRMDPTGIAVFHQADCGEYLRDEDTLFASG